MLEQLQDNMGANLTVSKRRTSPFANTLRLNPRLAPEELLSVSQRHEANFAWHLWHVMVQGPQHCLNLVDFGSGILRLAKGSNGCKARKALGDAPSSLSIVERQCVEWSLSTSTMPSTTPRGKRPNDQKGRVHHLKHFKPTDLQSRRDLLVAETLAHNVQHIIALKLRQTATILARERIHTSEVAKTLGSLMSFLLLKAEPMDFHVFLVDWKAQP